MQRYPQTRRLAVESLENRSLLAGNVLASVDASGLLTITGDNAANYVNIRQLEPAGSSTTWPGARYSIEAWNTTTVNGKSAAAIVEGVKNVNIFMNDGRDTIYAVTPGRPNQLTNLPGVVNIDMGNNANDAFREALILRVVNHTEININLGTGRDGLEMYGIVYRLNVLGDPVYRPEDAPLPSGDDIIKFYDVTAGGPVSIDTKYGNDEVTVFATTIRPSATMTINAGGGNDRVHVAGDFKSAVRVDAGDGNDYVTVRMQQPTVLTVNTGRGNDEVQISASGSDAVFQKLAVWLGEGEDHLDLVSVKSLKSILGGGDGTDTLETHESLPNDLGDSTISGFEVFESA